MILAHAVPPFAARGLSGCVDEEDGLVTKVRNVKNLFTQFRPSLLGVSWVAWTRRTD